MKSRLEKAIEYIQGYCNKRCSCKNCKLVNKETGFCMLEDKVPCDWDVKIKESDEE